MGDYSVICAVSGIPIDHRHTVIGFEVEPYRYKGGGHFLWVPHSWPVEGKYDMLGGIEGYDFSTSNIAMIHKDIWENAELYWHNENRKNGPDFIDVNTIREKAKNNAITYSGLTRTDVCFLALQDYLQNTDEGLVLRDLFNSQYDNIMHEPRRYCFIHRSRFAQLITKKIMKGMTKEDQMILYRIVCFYSAEMLTGKHIGPCNSPYVEQCPEYNQRIQILENHLNLIKKFHEERINNG